MATHLEIREFGGKSQGKNCDENVRERSGKFIKNVKVIEKSRKNRTVLQMTNVVRFISIFCQTKRIRVVNFTICYMYTGK